MLAAAEGCYLSTSSSHDCRGGKNVLTHSQLCANCQEIVNIYDYVRCILAELSARRVSIIIDWTSCVIDVQNGIATLLCAALQSTCSPVLQW